VGVAATVSWEFPVRSRTNKGVTKVVVNRSARTTHTIEGESPVCVTIDSPGDFPSMTGFVKAGLNLGGPPPKAKYSLVTDSGKVARAKDEKNPVEGS
jgi:hypothetical protein